MKKNIFTTAIALLLYASTALGQSGVGINQPVPDPSAALDIVSETQGILIPRMPLTAIQGIFLPANGLLAYNTDDNTFYLNTGSSGVPNWISVNPDMAVGFLVYPDGSPSIPYNTATKVNFIDATGFNDGSHFDDLNDNYIAPYAGVYQFNANVTINGMQDGSRFRVEIWVDSGSGATIVASNMSSVSASFINHSGSVSVTLKLTKFSRVSVHVTQGDLSSNPQNLSTTTTATWFSGHRLY